MATLLHTTGPTRACLVRTVTNDLAQGKGPGVYFPLFDHVGTTFDFTHECWLRASAFADAGPAWYALSIVRYHYADPNDVYEYWNEDTSSWDAGTASSGHRIKLILTDADAWQQLSVAFTTGAPDNTYELWSTLDDWGAGNATLVGQRLFLDDLDLHLTGTPFTSYVPNGGLDKDIIDALGVTGATNAAPIVLTLAYTGSLVGGDPVEVSGCAGNTAANGEWLISGVTNGIDATLTLVGSSGNGALSGTGAMITSILATSDTFDLYQKGYVNANRYWVFTWEDNAAETAAPAYEDSTAVAAVAAATATPEVEAYSDTTAVSATAETAATVEGGPLAPVIYSDVAPFQNRRIIHGGEENFKQGPLNPDRNVNEVRVDFISEWQTKTRSERVTVRDDAHQAAHTRVEKTLRLPAIKTADQGVRLAKWWLNRARKAGEGGRFTTKLAGIELMPGSIVGVTARAAGWTARPMRVRRWSFEENWDTRVELDHWTNAFFDHADEGEPPEFGLESLPPSVVLRVEDELPNGDVLLAWDATIYLGSALYYDVYVGAGPIDATAPEPRYLIARNYQRAIYLFAFSRANVGHALYARVVLFTTDLQQAVSNEVTFRTGDAEAHENMLYGSDGDDPDKWTIDAHAGGARGGDETYPTCSAGMGQDAADPAQALYQNTFGLTLWSAAPADPGHVADDGLDEPTLFPTIWRPFPSKTPAPGVNALAAGSQYIVSFSLAMTDPPSDEVVWTNMFADPGLELADSFVDHVSSPVQNPKYIKHGLPSNHAWLETSRVHAGSSSMMCYNISGSSSWNVVQGNYRVVVPYVGGGPPPVEVYPYTIRHGWTLRFRVYVYFPSVGAYPGETDGYRLGNGIQAYVSAVNPVSGLSTLLVGGNWYEGPGNPAPGPPLPPSYTFINSTLDAWLEWTFDIPLSGTFPDESPLITIEITPHVPDPVTQTYDQGPDVIFDDWVLKRIA